MKQETTGKKAPKERIVVLEKGKANDEISTLGAPCCSVTFMVLRFW